MEKSDNRAQASWVFPRFWAGILLVLIAVSYRLWIPSGEIPAVPMLGILDSVPSFIDLTLTLVMTIAALVILCSRTERPWIWWIIMAMLCGLFLLDQHRLQPWAYQTSLYALVFATLHPATARQWLIPLAASVYIYSALGKFDYQFVHTVGIDFLETAFQPIGGLADKLEFSTRAKLAHLFPAVELTAGVLLLVKPTRRIAGIVVMILHACLIGMLGPWGLNHSAGVLAWNFGLMIQAWFLFVNTAEHEKGKLFQLPTRNNSRGVAGYAACFVVLLAMALPNLERTGYWDHWPSWALYSPHNSRVDAQIHKSGLPLLPDLAREFVQDDTDGDGWQQLSLDRWSLEKRGVPIYPQGRYQLALCVALAKQAKLTDNIRCRLRGVSDRRTGKRKERQLLNSTEMQSALADYWLVPHNGK